MNTLPYREISSHEAFSMVAEQKANMVDVRTRAEFLKLHARKAAWLPIQDLPRRTGELPTQGALIFICTSGVRSALACEYALASGHSAERVFNLVGGTNEWCAMSLPIDVG